MNEQDEIWESKGRREEASKNQKDLRRSVTELTPPQWRD